MLSIHELETMILDEFRSKSSKTDISSKFDKKTNAYDRAGFLSEHVSDVIAKSNFLSGGTQKGRNSEPPFMFFNGEIYQYVEFALFRRCVRIFLEDIGMQHQDWFRFKNSIIGYAKEPVILKKFKRHPKYIAFKNCVVDFETMRCHDFNPNIHVDHQLEYDFDFKTPCPMWEQFLEQVLPDPVSRMVIQQYFGLAFLDRYNNENKVEKALILVGEGSNGKSVIFETILNIFGARNISTMDLNSMAKGGDEGQRSLAMLEGKRFNYCSEEQIGKVVQRSDIFKTLVSGEPIYARRIGENSFRIDNVPFLVFNMNKLPKFNDDTHGLYRRILIVGFNIIIPDELQDRNLSHKLKDERPGILRWLYQGYLELKSNRFQFPTSQVLTSMKEDFMTSQDSVMGWLMSHDIRASARFGIKDEPQQMLASDMYNEYMEYCEKVNIASESQNKWGRMMVDKGFIKRRSSGGMNYVFYGYGYAIEKTEYDEKLEGVDKMI